MLRVVFKRPQDEARNSQCVVILVKALSSKSFSNDSRTVTLFLLAIFITMLLLAAAMIAFVCSRPPRVTEFTPRVWYTSDNGGNDPETLCNSINRLGRPPSYSSSLSSHRASSFFMIPDGTGMPYNASESFKNDIISVSPSKPVIVGSESMQGGMSMKLMVTPPTPSKARVDESTLEELSFDLCDDSDSDEDEEDEESDEVM